MIEGISKFGLHVSNILHHLCSVEICTLLCDVGACSNGCRRSGFCCCQDGVDNLAKAKYVDER